MTEFAQIAVIVVRAFGKQLTALLMCGRHRKQFAVLRVMIFVDVASSGSHRQQEFPNGIQVTFLSAVFRKSLIVGLG
jgi:hypothetical protein